MDLLQWSSTEIAPCVISLAILAALLRTKSEIDSPLGVALVILQCEGDICFC